MGQRMAALERRSDLLAEWAQVPAEQCPDAVLIAVIARHLGWAPGHVPSDEELASVIAGEKICPT